MVDFLGFYVSTGFDVSANTTLVYGRDLCLLEPNSLECSAVNGRPISEGLNRVTVVDVIEVILRVQPFALCIVNHELQVRRDPGGLCRTQVDAENGCVGVLISDCYFLLASDA